MFKLYRYLKYYKKEVIFGPMFKLFEAILELLVPFVMTKVIMTNMEKGPSFIFTSGLFLVGLGIVGLASSLCCQRLACRASQGYGTRLRRDLYKHIQSLSYKELDELGSSSLINRLSTDINQMQTSVAMLIRLVVRAPFLVIGAIVMSYFTTKDIYITLIFLGSSLLIALLLFVIMKSCVPYYKKMQNQLDGVTELTKENLTGARVIRAFSGQEDETKRFEKRINALKNTNIAVMKISSLLNPLTYAILNLAIIILLSYSGTRFTQGNGTYTSYEVIALVQYMNQILVALVVVANLVVVFTKAQASANRINEVFQMKSSMENGTYQEQLSSVDLSFNDVSFAYHENKTILNHINFHFYSGETIGIIGTTGSGKSTLIQLIPRFYDVTSGEIILNNHNLKEFELNSLRNQIGVVSQGPKLFRGTIRTNLCMKKKDATNDEIMKALEISQAKDFVLEKQDGIDSEVLQGGKNFSGGQRQRLTIARTIINHPSILILDDASSALDFATDANLRKAIKENFKDSLVFIVTQRINALSLTDKIIVLDEGNMVGFGTQEELLETCEVYQKIATSQAKGGK
jgi:ATP-binding cassette subfamily B multidrug efflux pump